jgi:hypothetical protein
MEDFMKRLILLVVLLSMVVGIGFAGGPYSLVTIKQLNYLSADSLAVCDTLNYSNYTRWMAQVPAYYHATRTTADTVEIIGQVIVPPRVFWAHVKGWNMILRDTSAGDAFSYIYVRSGVDSGSPSTDTTNLLNDGFLNVEQGQIIRLRGFVSVYPTGYMTSLTQFVPVPGLTITPTAGPDIPAASPKKVSDFNIGSVPFSGSFPANGIHFTTGAPYESAYVQFTNLTVVGTKSSTTSANYIWCVDSAGNGIGTYDLSHWFTLRALYQVPNSGFTALPPVGAKIDTLRGMIMTVSGYNTYGYFVAPVYPGDLQFGVTLPGSSTHRRTPIVVTAQDTVQITVKAYKQSGGYGVRSVYLWHQTNSNPWVADSVLFTSARLTDSLYTFKLAKQNENDFTKYYFQVFDSTFRSSIYANAVSGMTSDTTKGYFAYQVISRQLTPYDVQYTPFKNGASLYSGAQVIVAGIVTADTSKLNAPVSSYYSGPWYIQSTSQPWSGIWIAATDTAIVRKLNNTKTGESIAVRGTVSEYYNVTEIYNIDSVVVYSSGNTMPDPAVITTADLGSHSNGDPIAEQWEDMLVRVNNVTVESIDPVSYADLTVMSVNDGSGRVYVRMADGKHKYSNVAGDSVSGKTILKVGDKLSYLQGIVYFSSVTNYAMVPRSNDDFGTIITGIASSNSSVPTKLGLSQNYPNPFNPSTKIEFDIPVGGTVTLKVYNILGQEVASLVNGYRSAGHYTTQFDASRFSTGVYVYRLQSASNVMTKRMVLLK